MCHITKVSIPGGGGWGCTLIFSSYVGSGPASTVHSPKNIRKFKHPRKSIWNFSNPQKNPPFCTLTLWNTLKCIEMTPKYSPIFRWPQIFFVNPKKYWNSKFWIQKNDPCLRMCENIRVPPLGSVQGLQFAFKAQMVAIQLSNAVEGSWDGNLFS